MAGKKRSVFFGTLAVIAVMAAFLPCVKVLSVTNTKNNSERVLWTQGAQEFCIHYTHSVNKGRVRDYYRTGRNNELVLYKTEFVSYGAGMPEIEETPGATFAVEEGTYTMFFERNVGNRLLLAAGVIAEHSVSFPKSKGTPDRECFLKDFFQLQKPLEFRIKRASPFQLAMQKLKIREVE